MKQSHRSFFRYELGGTGSSEFSIDLNTAPKELNRMTHTLINQRVKPVYFFNRAIKRGDTVLITGDKPRFALMRNFFEDRNDPPHNKLGDGAVCIEIDGAREYLHEAENIQTIFTESGTCYTIQLKHIKELTVKIFVSQMEDFGLAVKVQLFSTGSEKRTAIVTFDYGGICIHGRTYTGAYFFLENDDYKNNHITINGNEAILENTQIPEKINVWCEPKADTSVEKQRVILTQTLEIPARGMVQSSFFAARLGTSQKHPMDVDAVLREAKSYTEKLVSEFAVDTPDEILNAAFLTALYNMEYLWNGKAWVEGLHWWVAPWCQNYQLSAATVLGQYDRVQQVIERIGKIKPYPAPGLNGCLKAMTEHIGVYTHGSDDGLPYYLYQLCQYYDATGDGKAILDIWEPICLGIDKFFELRSDENGFVNFHLGCNMFLYQADHLALPGNAASPTLFMAGILEQMSKTADSLGKNSCADKWKAKADELYQNLSLLWDREEEDFYSHIDLQGIKHKALYYTDLVFPMLYTSLPDWIKKKCLDKLFNTIMLESQDGRLLMRVGELKPDIFGNSHVSPTQMCEAARALYMAGEYETAARLLSSVAYSATVYTESPGSFPERMDDDGKGEANYIFGNPAGAFCYTFVSGLFGIDLCEGGKMLRCIPAFPYSWDHASLTLPYASLSFVREKNEREVIERYTITSSVPRMLRFKTSPDTFAIYEVKLNGEKGIRAERFESLWGEASSKYADTHFEVTIRYCPKQVKLITNRISPRKKVSCLTYDRLNTCKNMDFIPIPLKTDSLQDTIPVSSAWRSYPYTPDLTPYQIEEEGIRIEEIPFLVEKALSTNYLSPRMIVLEFAHSDAYTNQLVFGNHSSAVTLPLQGKGQMLALLYISECRSRNTGCEGGDIFVEYTDGSGEHLPLVVGKMIDTIFSHFAEDTVPVYLPSELERHPIHPGKDYANLYLLMLDDSKELKNITFSIKLADIYFGLIGMTLLK